MKKAADPSTSMESVGITLVSVEMRAVLPWEKFSASYTSLECKHHKRQLLSLLGHLNFVISQGLFFISCLLKFATSMPNSVWLDAKIYDSGVSLFFSGYCLFLRLSNSLGYSVRHVFSGVISGLQMVCHLSYLPSVPFMRSMLCGSILCVSSNFPVVGS